MNPIRSCNLTAGGKETFFPLPIVCPIDIDDPRIVEALLPYELSIGPRKNLQLPVGLLNTVVKRGWEPWTFAWSAQIDVQADIYAYTANAGAATDIIRPPSPIRRTISPFLIQTEFRSFPIRSQPDFTIDPNERPLWVDNVPATAPVGPGVPCPHLAAAPLGDSNVFPLAYNISTTEVVGAIMVVQCTLNISRFTPYIWSDGSAYYCALNAVITSQARPAAAAEIGQDGNWTFAFYGPDWTFSGIDETSQELLGGTFDSTDPISAQAGVLNFKDEVNSPVEAWGSLQMFGNEFGIINGATVSVVQHYGD